MKTWDNVGGLHNIPVSTINKNVTKLNRFISFLLTLIFLYDLIRAMLNLKHPALVSEHDK